jgi:hypothetical protein
VINVTDAGIAHVPKDLLLCDTLTIAVIAKREGDIQNHLRLRRTHDEVCK